MFANGRGGGAVGLGCNEFVMAEKLVLKFEGFIVH